jgi:hypothetical protein
MTEPALGNQVRGETEKEIEYFTREAKSRRTCEAKCLIIRQVI